jgi:hypothetical protein
MTQLVLVQAFPSVQAKQTLGHGPNMLQHKMVCIHLRLGVGVNKE